MEKLRAFLTWILATVAVVILSPLVFLVTLAEYHSRKSDPEPRLPGVKASRAIEVKPGRWLCGACERNVDPSTSMACPHCLTPWLGVVPLERS